MSDGMEGIMDVVNTVVTETAPQQTQQTQQPEPAPVTSMPENYPTGVPGDQILSQEQIKALLEFDPVAKLEQIKAQEEKEGLDALAKANLNAPQPAGTKQTPPVVQPTQAQPISEVAQLTDLVKTLVQNQQQPQNQPQQTQPESPQGPFYNFKLPTEILAAVDSDDPATRHAGLNVIVNGLANLVHNNTMKMLAEQVIPSLRSEMLATYQTQTQAKETRQTFYTAHPDLDNPKLHPVVLETAKEYATELGAKFTAMTPEFNAEVARRVYSLFGRQAPQGQQQTQQPPVQQQTPVSLQPAQNVVQLEQKRTPFFTGGGARPPAANSSNSLSAEIMDTIRA